ncbi:lipase family protein [Paenibacillus sp. YN15]|uniref:lipase family protein n=1 Tax=Paenibacillus sp. YN15 TaxID=1742774 RepID=UPI0015EBBD06|nr:lipase family protein [Paenibacillus sp. YN15]
MKQHSQLLRMAAYTAEAVRQYRTGLPPELPKGFRCLTQLEAPGFPRMGYVAVSGPQIVIAFRGTKEAGDWKKDLLAAQLPYPYQPDKGWRTHAGFTELYRLLRPGLQKALGRAKSNRRLFITGYSLGGALACLCAMDPAVRRRAASVRLYTFGAPRVGNPAFAEALSKRTASCIRAHNDGDWVPTMPPEKFLGAEYRHGGRSFPLHNRKLTPVSSHSFQTYLEALEEWKLEDKSRPG